MAALVTPGAPLCGKKTLAATPAHPTTNPMGNKAAGERGPESTCRTVLRGRDRSRDFVMASPPDALMPRTCAHMLHGHEPTLVTRQRAYGGSQLAHIGIFVEHCPRQLRTLNGAAFSKG